MRKSFLLLTGLALITFNSMACEICGCGNSNFQIGLLPTFNKGFIGLRYSASRFSSQLQNDASQFSHDYFKTMELWGGYNFKKFQIIAFMPYVVSRKESDDGVTISSGVGDFLLLTNYRVLSKTYLARNERTTMRHELYMGGGVKLPTGINRVDTSNPGFNIGDFNSQAGTGSTDFIFNLTHNLLWNNSGIVTNVAYRINTANKQDYRFGNRSYLNTSYYYTFNTKGLKIRPNMGINYQSNLINSFQGIDVENSNGYSLNSTVGVNLNKGKIGLNAVAFVPVLQNMYDGQTKFLSGMTMGLTYSF